MTKTDPRIPGAAPAAAPDRPLPPQSAAAAPGALRRTVPVLITLLTVAVAGGISWRMWQTDMAAPWTRDGWVRAYVVTMAPEVAGRVVALPVADNQFVHKGDLLLTIEPTDDAIAVDLAQAAVAQARAQMENAQREATRRAELSTLETSEEQKQTYATTAVAAAATYQQSLANLAQARVNLERTNIRSPVNGYVTNLLVQLGDYARIGTNLISLVDADSYWIDGYFEETDLHAIRPGDPAQMQLMGHRDVLRGHVESIARGINVANATPDQAGPAQVNPIFTWVWSGPLGPDRVRRRF